MANLRRLRRLMVLALTLACALIAVVWPDWRLELRAFGYYSIPLSGTSWNVSGKSSLSYSYTYEKKKHSATVVTDESGTMTFAANGTFSGNVFTGTWTQKGNNYTLSVEPSVTTFIENLLSKYGFIGTLTIKTITIGGTVSSTKKITLTAHVKGTIAVASPEEVTVSFTDTITLSGTPATTTALYPVIAGDEDSPLGQSEIFGEMLDDIVESINGNR